jgi:predicted lipid-binding transport protein (Tim44 family)
MRRPNRTQLIGIAAAVGMLLVAAAAFARPGGGHSYSGPSSGGGGSGSGELIGLLIWLVFEHPVIGIPVLIVVIIVAIVRSRTRKPSDGWATVNAGGGASGWQAEPVQRPTIVSRTQLDQLRRIDPEFSAVLFEDFAYLLYAQLQRGRAGQLAPLAPYVHAPILQALHSDPNLADVRGIVIGAMRIVSFSGIGIPRIHVELEFEANLEEVFRQGGLQRFYVLDRILLVRAREAKSRPFARARILDCPNCGAPLSAVRGTQCTYCKQEVGGGRFDWQVEGARTLSREQRGPLLTSNVEETGTDLPTITAPGADVRMQELQRRDPGFRWETLQHRVAHIFGALQAGWSGRDASMIRPYISDNLFQSMVYWIDLYTRERCRNANEQASILRIDLANVLSDKHYDAITLRLFAQGMDYTISDDGRLLSGSRSRLRTYSEYWTLIRGAQKKGEPKGDANCPNCGAPLKIDQVGNCTYCSAKVTSGEFDWVLSRIEQDEAYSG